MALKLRIHTNIFNPVYLPHLEPSGHRFLVFYGGAGSGKSYFIAQRLIYKALKSKRKILVLRKVNRTTKNSTFQLLLDVLSQFNILKYCNINRTDFTITLPNGSSFLCMGLDDPEKIKSIAGLTDAWLEEATEFTLDDFSQINLRVRDPQAQDQEIILSLNPVSKANWCYLHFFADNPELEEFRKTVKIIHTTYLDNPHLPEDYVKALLMMKATNEVYYKIYALGEFGSLDKLIYNNWQVMEFNPDNIKGQLLCGLDFGYTNDVAALISCIVDEENMRIWIFDEFYKVGQTNLMLANVLKYKGYNKEVIR